MPYFTKDSLYPDTFYASGPDGERVSIEFTAPDVHHHYNRVKELLAAGFPIPVGWEHQSSAYPMPMADMESQLAEKTRRICGYIEDVQLDENNTIQFLVNIPDEEDARQAAKVRFVSPEIKRDFVDGKNRLWPGQSITHLAITSCPVQMSQGGFRPVRMSLANCPGTIRLSIGANMADDKEKEKDDLEEEASSEPEAAPEPTPEAPAEPEASTDDASDVDSLGDEEGGALFDEEGGGAEEPIMPEEDMSSQTLIPELKSIFSAPPFNIVFPDLVNDTKSFLEHLLTGMMTSKAHMAAGEMEKGPEQEGNEAMAGNEENPNTGQGMEEVPNQSVLMSLRRENDTLKQTILEREKQNLKARVQRIAKFVKSKKTRDRLNTAMGTVRLSLGAGGKMARNELIALVEGLEDEYLHSDEAIKRRKLDKAKKELEGAAVRLSADHGVKEQQPPVSHKADLDNPTPEQSAVIDRMTGGQYSKFKNEGKIK